MSLEGAGDEVQRMSLEGTGDEDEPRRGWG